MTAAARVEFEKQEAVSVLVLHADMGSLFQLPEELLLSPLFERYPCREQQIRSLATLLHVIPQCASILFTRSQAHGYS